MYFNTIHFIAYFIVFILFGVYLFFVLKYSPKKDTITYTAIGSVLFLAMLVFSTFMVDNLTKKAKLIGVKTQASHGKVRVYGTVKNIGKYHITKCYLTVKVSTKFTIAQKTGANYFKTRGFSDMNVKASKKTSAQEKKLIAKPLKINKQKRFSFYVMYPKHFRAMTYKYNLECV